MALEDLLHPYLGKYLGAPGWLKASAGRAYSMLPARVRLGGAYERFRSEVCSDTNAHDVEARLGAALEWALDTVPAYEGYRHVLAGSRSAREALSHLPVTDKLDIKRHPERYLSTAMPEHARLEMYTGGSTRNPMRFFLQKHVTRAKEYAFIQDFRARIGVGPHDTVLALRGRTVPSGVVTISTVSPTAGITSSGLTPGLIPGVPLSGTNPQLTPGTAGRLNLGNFLAALLNFVIIAFAVFVVIVKMLGGVMKRAGSTPAPSAPTTKECPECLSIIPIKARRCQNCTSQQPPEATPTAT